MSHKKSFLTVNSVCSVFMRNSVAFLKYLCDSFNGKMGFLKVYDVIISREMASWFLNSRWFRNGFVINCSYFREWQLMKYFLQNEARGKKQVWWKFLNIINMLILQIWFEDSSSPKSHSFPYECNFWLFWGGGGVEVFDSKSAQVNFFLKSYVWSSQRPHDTPAYLPPPCLLTVRHVH